MGNMELTKNIFFNTDKLIENSKVKISYTGKFYQDDCEKVIVHYGFGEQWDNVNDIEMEKTELGFQTEIDLLEGESFDLCFKNENDEWDNNDGNNYISKFNCIRRRTKNNRKNKTSKKILFME